MAAEESDAIDLLEETATKTRLSPGDRQHVYLFSLRVSQQPFLHLVVNYPPPPPRVHVSFIITNAKYVNLNSDVCHVISRCPGTVPVLVRKLPSTL